MIPLWLEVGEHRIVLQACPERFLSFFRTNYCISASPSSLAPDIVLDVTEGYGTPFRDYRVNVRTDGERLSFTRADYRIETSAQFARAYISVNDELALKHALTNLYSAFIVSRGWGLLLHSSAVVDDRGSAHVFAGASGAGKSTVAALSSPRAVLADEAALLKIDGARIVAYDSPFRSDMPRSSFGSGPHTLGGLHLLRQSTVPERRRIPPSEALLQLMDKVFYWPYDPEATKQALRLLRSLVVAVPAYELHFRKDPSFWELISC